MAWVGALVIYHLPFANTRASNPNPQTIHPAVSNSAISSASARRQPTDLPKPRDSGSGNSREAIRARREANGRLETYPTRTALCRKVGMSRSRIWSPEMDFGCPLGFPSFTNLKRLLAFASKQHAASGAQLLKHGWLGSKAAATRPRHCHRPPGMDLGGLHPNIQTAQGKIDFTQPLQRQYAKGEFRLFPPPGG